MSDPSTNDLGDPSTTPLRDLSLDDLKARYQSAAPIRYGATLSFGRMDGRNLDIWKGNALWFARRSEGKGGATSPCRTLADLDAEVRWVAGEAE